LSATGASSF
jgi:hypothetical protein